MSDVKPIDRQNFVASIKDKMQMSIMSAVQKFSTLQVGVARSNFLDTVYVEAYGQKMLLKQVATISVVDNFTLSVVPFDKSNTKAVIQGIQEANLGVGVIAEATSIRITMPKITEERRKEYVKILGKYSEEGKIAIRNVRRDANDAVKVAKKNSEISEDEARRIENDIQKLTDQSVIEIEQLTKKKEQEILKI